MNEEVIYFKTPLYDFGGCRIMCYTEGDKIYIDEVMKEYGC